MDMLNHLGALSMRMVDGQELKPIPYSDTAQKEYIQAMRCPGCNSDHCTQHDEEWNDVIVFRSCLCNDCGEKWDEVLTFQKIVRWGL